MHTLNSTSSSGCMAYMEPTKIATITASVVMTFFLLLGISGNAWTLWVLVRCTKLRQNVINSLILSLCLNDIVNLTLLQTFVLGSYYCNRWALGTISCFVIPEANMILIGTSLWHHAFISFHRYLVVVQYDRYLRIRKRPYILVVILGSRAFPTILTLVFNSVSYVNFLNSPGGYQSTSLSFIHQLESFARFIMFYSPFLLRCVYKRNQHARIVCVIFLTVILPCIVVIFCFASIFIHVRRKNFLQRRCPQPPKCPNEVTKWNTLIMTPRNEIQLSPSTLAQTGSEDDDEKPSFDFSISTLGVDDELTLQFDHPAGQFQFKMPAQVVPGESKGTQIQKKLSDFMRTRLSLDKRRISREMKITKMFCVIFTLFLAGYLPYGLIRLADGTTIDPEDCLVPAGGNATAVDRSRRGTPPDVYVFLSVVYAIASCCNPLIFGLMHKDVRKNAFKNLGSPKSHHRCLRNRLF
ncbi:unnamed protein product [Mesocestoides corti]|uniref:G_PROTEIN_RECEP_F1_2 domain-containing protein n=1 Tax=Mesocestoides corti TaxID=53468 RepID=A0A0R3U2K0_MESCO|nr:unnamed protein product [Mesocestoides corti]